MHFHKTITAIFVKISSQTYMVLVTSSRCHSQASLLAKGLILLPSSSTLRLYPLRQPEFCCHMEWV
jgi:hypothetical protein